MSEGGQVGHKRQRAALCALFVKLLHCPPLAGLLECLRSRFCFLSCREGLPVQIFTGMPSDMKMDFGDHQTSRLCRKCLALHIKGCLRRCGWCVATATTTAMMSMVVGATRALQSLLLCGSLSLPAIVRVNSRFPPRLKSHKTIVSGHYWPRPVP